MSDKSENYENGIYYGLKNSIMYPKKRNTNCTLDFFKGGEGRRGGDRRGGRGYPVLVLARGYPCPGSFWGRGILVLGLELGTPSPSPVRTRTGVLLPLPQKGPRIRGWEGTRDQRLGYPFPRKDLGPESLGRDLGP